MKKEEFERILKEGENQFVEFKESLSLKDEIGENVSAFSNTNKGLILIGLSDLGRIKGIDMGKKTIEDLANYIKQNTDNHIFPAIETPSIGKKRIVVIHINESPEKPVFFKGVAYKRVGKSVHKMSASEIRAIAKESSKTFWDEQICKDSIYRDLDKKKVDWYLEQRENHRNVSKELKIPLKRFLENIKALKNNKPTNGGVLFFGKEPLLKISQAQLRMALIKGDDLSGIILDRIDCEGTLPEMVDQAELFFKKHIYFIGLRTEKSFQREDKFNIPIKSLRELIINALIHRDYDTAADVRVFIFDNRVEIINPGHFPKGVSPENPSHHPVNKSLSQYMYDIGFIEKYGSGIINVRNLLKENGNKEQEYFFNALETKATVYMQGSRNTPVKDTVNDTAKDTVSLSKKEKIVLSEIRRDPLITAQQISGLLKINLRNAKKYLAILKKKKIIKRIGPDKGGHWEVVNK